MRYGRSVGTIISTYILSHMLNHHSDKATVGVIVAVCRHDEAVRWSAHSAEPHACECHVCENDNYSTTNLVTSQDKGIPLTEEILVKGIYIVLKVWYMYLCGCAHDTTPQTVVRC